MSYCAIVQHRPTRDLPNLLVAMGGGAWGTRRLPVTSFCFPFLIRGECHENGLAVASGLNMNNEYLLDKLLEGQSPVVVFKILFAEFFWLSALHLHS